jgi:hypothetical protein
MTKDSIMLCPVCAALNREHNQECRAEANATLRQRAEWIGGHSADRLKADQLKDEVLRSRKRQAHIAFELHEHQSKQHPIVKAAAG